MLVHETMEERAEKIFSGGVNSPIRALKGLRENPLIVKNAFRDTFIDSNDMRYIDYCNSWGSLIHGHAHPYIVDAVNAAMQQGSSYGLTSEKEIALGEFILRHVLPKDHKLRFMSSGTEATMTAVRLARGFTGKDLIIKFDGHYHGHADIFLVNAGSVLAEKTSFFSLGVSASCSSGVVSIPFNDSLSLFRVVEQYGNRIAAIILEPVAANMGLVFPDKEFLDTLSSVTKKIGALLIADEVYTGFRLGLKGSRDMYNFSADITVFGKILGGGFPVAAVCANKEIIDLLAPKGNVFQAGTLSGNPVSMAAGLACLEMCSHENFYDDLHRSTEFLLDPVQSFIEETKIPVLLERTASVFSFFFTEEKKLSNLKDVQKCNTSHFKEFFNMLLAESIYISPSQFEASFVSTAHSKENL